MRKKVLFLSYHDATYLGVRILANIIKKRYDVSYLFIMDYFAFNYSEGKDIKKYFITPIIEFIKNYDYVLISSTSFDGTLTFLIADKIKEVCPSVKVVIGGLLGIHHTAECLKHSEYVCAWEGFNIMELLDCIEGKREKRDIQNFAIRDSKVKLASLPSLDLLPAPDYDLPTYIFYRGTVIYRPKFKPKSINYESSRGCIYNCTYCHISKTNQIRRKNSLGYVTRSSMDKILSDLEKLVRDNRRIDTIYMVDEDFFIYSEEEIRYFVQEYNTRIGKTLDLLVDPRSSNFLLKLSHIFRLKKQCKIHLGIQSGSYEFNKSVYNRIHDYDALFRYNKFINALKPKSVELTYYIILANPLEERKDVLETINFMLKLKHAHFEFPFLSAIPNTVLYEKLHKSQKRINCFSDVNYAAFKKHAFYFMIYFAIDKINKLHLEAILPSTFRQSTFTEILNKWPLSLAYFKFINLKNRLDLKRKHKKQIKDILSQ